MNLNKLKKDPEFFLDCERNGMTFDQIGKVLGVSKQYAAYLFRQAVKRSKKYSFTEEGRKKRFEAHKKRWTPEKRQKLRDALKK